MNKNTKKIVKNIRGMLGDFGRKAKTKNDANINFQSIISTKRILSAIEIAWGWILLVINCEIKLDDIENKFKQPEMINSLIQLGASAEILLSQALIEKGNEYEFSDVNLKFNFAELSEMLRVQGFENRKLFFSMLGDYNGYLREKMSKSI